LTILTEFEPSLLQSLEQRLKRELDRREEIKRLEGSLIEFFRAAWPEFDPAPYVHGWHLEAIAEHLEAVSYGQIRKLLVNIAPRHSKTLLTSVAWPAWLWAKEPDPKFPLIGPQAKFLCLSYGDHLALDSATTMRRLVQGKWYQDRWGKRVQLTADQEAKSKFDTTVGGTRISSSFGGTVTGRGGDIKIIDDPLKADEAESEVKREHVLRTYDGTLKSRITDPKHSAEVIIMQRLHERDLSEHVLDTDPDFVHLWLPEEYEPDRKCVTSIGWSDPRTEEGELLWPERFGPKELEPFRRNPYEWAGQWQQRPEVRGGAIFKREDWGLYITESGKLPTPDYVVASLDPAYTEKQENDPSGFTVWSAYRGEDGHTKLMCINAWMKRLPIHGYDVERQPGEKEAAYIARCKPHWGLVEWVAHSCRVFKVNVLLIESKASGLSVAQEMARLHRGQGYSVQLVDPKGADKVARAWAVQHLFADGMIELPAYEDGSLRDWGQQLVDQCAAFPKGANDDLVDSTTQALRHLRDRHLAVRKDERAMAEMEAGRHRSQPKPLYPA